MRHLLLFTGILMAVIASVFSVNGLAMLYGGAWSVFFLFGSLDLAKIGLASAFHSIFERLSLWYKSVTLLSIIVLTFITGLGVYAGLNAGFAEVVNALDSSERQISLVTTRLDRLKMQDSTNNALLNQVNGNIGVFRQGLANPGQVSWVQNGETVTSTDSRQRRIIQDQLKTLESDKAKLDIIADELEARIITFEDSIGTLKLSQNKLSEAGPMIFISRQVNTSIETVSLIFSLIIVLIFDPLALTMISIWTTWDRKVKAEQTEEPVISDPDPNDVDDDDDNNLEEQEVVPIVDLTRESEDESLESDLDEAHEGPVEEPEIEEVMEKIKNQLEVINVDGVNDTNIVDDSSDDAPDDEVRVVDYIPEEELDVIEDLAGDIDDDDDSPSTTNIYGESIMSKTALMDKIIDLPTHQKARFAQLINSGNLNEAAAMLKTYGNN